jgi:hypothetical protein
VVSAVDPYGRNLGFLDHFISIKVNIKVKFSLYGEVDV